MSGATQHAHAKLTVSLRVVGTRPDGYHLVDAEMVTLDLADTLTFTAATTTTAATTAATSTAATDGSARVDSPSEGVLTIESTDHAGRGLPVTANADNLVAKALRMVGRGADVHLVKRIPAGGGLGGGSADAAAVFRWAGRVTTDDVVLASRLGADVSFCIVGGRARVTGIGEVIAPLPFVDRTFTLLTPPFGVSTPAVYRAWDELGGPTAPGPNDLEPAAILVEPRLVAWRDRLGDFTGQTPILAGSGSTSFVEGAFTGRVDGADLVVARTIPAF